MSEADIILDNIDNQLDQYFDGVGFFDDKKGKQMKENWLVELGRQFHQLNAIKLTFKQQARRTQLYKYYRSINRQN